MVSTSNIKKTFSILEKEHQPTMLEELSDYTPYQKLVMTLLSARTKDSTTIPIVKKFFAKYPQVENVVKISQKELEKWFYKIGFFRVKAKNVKKLSEIVIDKYKGKVPDTIEELTSLPGVGRKTANCMLCYAFGKPAIAVDIHVHRISNRLGWIETKNPEESEIALEKIVPKEMWIKVNSLLVGHGQTICSPINPKCKLCPILKLCNYKKKIL